MSDWEVKLPAGVVERSVALPPCHVTSIETSVSLSSIALAVARALALPYFKAIRIFHMALCIDNCSCYSARIFVLLLHLFYSSSAFR
mmetsp:Transcript_12359/g.34709  ORF Transcript_12359/g.34709 Transcript_12359/m.34709 type:complete len:87 (+) Transcript_12359:147-407(+)